MTAIPKPKRLEQVLDEHAETIEQDGGTYRVFKASGNAYRESHGRAIDNHHRFFYPIVDGIERVDLRIGAPAPDAIARVLQREGIIT